MIAISVLSWEALHNAMAARGPDSVGVLSSLWEPSEGSPIIGKTGPAVGADEEFIVVVLVPS